MFRPDYLELFILISLSDLGGNSQLLNLHQHLSNGDYLEEIPSSRKIKRSLNRLEHWGFVLKLEDESYKTTPEGIRFFVIFAITSPRII